MPYSTKVQHLDPHTLQRIDTANMRELIASFPEQIRDAVHIGESANVKLKAKNIHNIIITGLGGSAIGGDLLRSYLADELEIPIIVNRHYFLPEFVNQQSLVIVSSYSGNTEETIAAHKDALKRKAAVICITSNGETERFAVRKKNHVIKIPKGYPPRAALGYSFFPTLIILSKLGFIKNKRRDIDETVSLLKKKSELYAQLNAQENTALRLAQKLHGKLPVIYSAAEHFDSVNLRWRGQLSENAKVLAFGNVLPEMNHNELVGWKVLNDLMKNMVVIILRDKGDHRRVQVRVDITRGIVQEYASRVIEVWSEGSSLLTRMFSLIHLGDWVSYYLAILDGVDPTPVKVIDYLKSELGKV